jgi:hypothetical protein
MEVLEQVAREYVEAFNEAVGARDFRVFLTRFADDAVMRFENVPGAGVLEYVGQPAYAAAYAQQPPDDQLEIDAAVRQEGAILVIPFVWRRDGAPGEIRLTFRNDLITRMVAAFG